MKYGLIHIYTGMGKGKTTAAVGLAIRALSRGLKVCYLTIHKRPEKYGFGEMNILRQAGANVINRAMGHPKLDKSIDPIQNSKEIYEALDELEELLSHENYDLLVIDEIINSVRNHYLTEQRLLDFIARKPQNLELVLTGRGATPAVIAQADYVSEITKIKHPFDAGQRSRLGIEF